MAKRSKVRLPDEVVVEIFSWLPIHYLSPLRFLSKHWYQLLTQDPHFAKLHFDHSLKIYNPCIVAISPLSFLLNAKLRFFLASAYTDCDKAKIVKIPIGHGEFRVSGICNGLICLSSKINDNSKVFIWNPFIGEHITIPVSRPQYQFPDHKIKAINFGFGFDEAINKYEVLRFFGEEEMREWFYYNVHSHITVYTLGIDSSWRILVKQSPYDISFWRSSYVNGVLHWFATRRTVSSFVILAFDVKDEVFCEMLPPFPVDKRTELMNLGEMLSIFCGFPGDIQIWVMKEYGAVNSWTKQFTILETDPFRDYVFFLILLAANQNGEIIIWGDFQKMIVYSPETTSYRKLEEFGFAINAAHAFIGSIISPRAISAVSVDRHIMTKEI